MKSAEANRFKKLYQSHLRLLKLQGKSQKTIDAYSRAVRRVSHHRPPFVKKFLLSWIKTYDPYICLKNQLY